MTVPAGQRGRVHGAAGALAVLMSLTAPAGVSAQVGRVEVHAVRFDGNHAFPDDSLARAISTRQTECRSVALRPFCWFGANFSLQRSYFRKEDLPLDQLRLMIFYQQRGYREAAIDTATVVRDDGSVDVRFTVTEGRPVLVDSLVVRGVDEVEDRSLMRDLPLRRGDRLNRFVLDATRDTLIRRLGDRGYARADVLRSFLLPASDPYAARVTFDATLGPVVRYGSISIEGNRQLSDGVIRKTLQFRRGDLYRTDQLLEAQLRLFAMDLLRSARVEPDFAAGPDSIVPIHVTVQEGDLRRVRAGAGWSSAECLDSDARWISRNFLGGGRRLQVRGRVSNLLAQGFHELLCPQSGGGVFGKPNWLASLDFTQPWIFSTRNSLSVSLFTERQSLPDVFVRKAVGVAFSLTRSLAPGTPLTVSYRPELSTLDAAEILFCTGFLVCTPRDIDVLQGANWLAPVGVNITRNRSDNLLNPTRGYTLVLDVEHAAGWTGSNFRYDRAIVEGTMYERAGRGTVVATRLRAGWVGAGPFSELLGGERASIDVVHPQKRFYAGGANSVRGFAQNRLGPRVLTVDPTDLLAPPTRGGARCSPEQIMDLSCDATPMDERRFSSRPTGGTRVLEGNVEFRFPLGSRMQGVTFTDFGQVWGARQTVHLRDLEFSPGIGVRYPTPIGPVRVDLAYRFRGGQSLPVVTSQLRPFDSGFDAEQDRLVVGGQVIPWVRVDQLAVLGKPVFFGRSGAASLSRLQLHISIGQAF